MKSREDRDAIKVILHEEYGHDAMVNSTCFVNIMLKFQHKAA
jgi:hypothetical protein